MQPNKPKRANLNIRREEENAPRSATVEKKEIEVKKVIFRLKATAKRQLDKMAFDGETTKQDLFLEALNDLFRKYERPPIA